MLCQAAPGGRAPAAGGDGVCAGGFPLRQRALFHECLRQRSLQHPESEGVFFGTRLHLKENKRTNSWQVNITVCSHVPGVASARVTLFPTDTYTVVTDS